MWLLLFLLTQNFHYIIKMHKKLLFPFKILLFYQIKMKTLPFSKLTLQFHNNKEAT